MPRVFVAFVLAVSLGTAAPLAGAADPAADASAPVPAGGDPALRAKDAGTIDGEVVAVDYRAGTIAVQAGSRRVVVVVLPSTNIAGNDSFDTIADIKKGSRVHVILSRRAGTYIAQIIRLQ